MYLLWLSDSQYFENLEIDGIKIEGDQLNIDINSKALKNKMIEINTLMKFEDKEESQQSSLRPHDANFCRKCVFFS